MLPLAAALIRAYSRSKASKREYLAVMVELLLRERSWSGSDAREHPAPPPAKLLIDDTDEAGEMLAAPAAGSSVSWRERVGDSGGARTFAWSGCSNVLLSRLVNTALPPAVVVTIPDDGLP